MPTLPTGKSAYMCEITDIGLSIIFPSQHNIERLQPTSCQNQEDWNYIQTAVKS
jgi:hypothetical protein